MFYLCPNCGHALPTPLEDGICVCPTCRHDVSDNLYDRLMNAAWTCRRKHVDCADRLVAMTRYRENEVILVAAYMIDNGYSIDEFKGALRELGIRK